MSRAAGRLAGKVIAVTGASRGLGATFAKTLAAEGANLVLLARPSDDFDRFAQTLPDAIQVLCDVGAPDSVRRAFAKINDTYGKLDVLINNAALNLPNLIGQATDQDIIGEVTTNLMGPIFCTRSALPLLRAAGGGDIVNISSIGTKRPFPYLSIYGATKAGLETLSAHHREELRKENIRVVVLRSGSVSGGNLSASWDPEQKKNYLEALRSSGILDYVGGAVSPITTADMLVHVLTMPREAAVDIIEVRGI